MKKLKLITLMLIITVKGFSQCGVVAGFQPHANSSNIGSTLQTDCILDPGWNIYSMMWLRNGAFAGNTSTISNDGEMYDNICLNVKATNPSTGDSCESDYCQLIFTDWPGLFSLYIDAIPAGPKTMQIDGRIVTTYNQLGSGFMELDYGDGIIEQVNSSMHVYADTGTYEVKFTYYPPFGLPDSIKRKVYVDNGQTNFSVGAVSGTNTCFTANTVFTSTPPFINGWVEPSYVSPLCLTNYLPINPGISFQMQYRGPGVDFINCYAADSSGNGIKSSKLIAIPDCKVAPDTMSGTIWLDTDADGLWDAGENPFLSNANIKFDLGNYIADFDGNGNYSIPVPQIQSYVTLSTLNTNYELTFPGGGYGHLFNFNTSTNHPGYNFGLTLCGVNICGKAFVDLNNNGVYNSGTDFLYSGVLINALNTVLNKNYSTTTDTYGNYCFELPVGNYVLKTVSNNLDSAYSVPDSIIVNAPVAGNQYNNDFGFQTPVQGGNLGIFLSSGGMPRPGFNYSLGSVVTNSGVDASSGTVVINYSPTLIYVSSSTGGVHNATNKTVTWQSGVMAPTTSKYFTANFTVPVSTPLGTNLISSAVVTTGATYTDYNLNNNSSLHTSTVIGSYDPNDKLVTPKGIGANGNVLHSQRMYYRINFQNTGTASAINIIVQDSINGNLDMSTFRMERASHSYTTSIIGNVITWKFFNINLPDSNANEPLSHGYIEFSIKPKQGLPDGTIISNDADIYFDFNPPIVTNTVSNTLQTSLTGISENEIDSKFVVYPNPFRNEIMINTVDITEIINEVSLFDIYGKEILIVVKKQSTSGETFVQLPEIANGVYFIKIETGSGTVVRKMLKQ